MLFPGRMRADLEFLCSPELHGRVSLQPGANVAARFIAAEFQHAGLKPAFGDSFFQTFGLVEPRLEAEKTLITLASSQGGVREFRSGKDFRGGVRMDVSLDASVVFAGYGITAPEYGYDDYAQLDVKGKVVVVFSHEPQESDPASKFLGRGFTLYAGTQHKVQNAQRRGAVLLLIVSDPNGSHRSPFDSGSVPASSQRSSAPLQRPDAAGLPYLTISAAMAEALTAGSGNASLADLQQQIDSTLQPHSKAFPDLTLHVRLVNASVRQGQSRNVVGLLPGSDPALSNEVILIGSHYDHLPDRGETYYPGANDNGSGTVAVMELARVFAAMPKRHRRTIAFASFGSEEELMLGSFYYVDHPVGVTRAMVNLDMIGRNEAETPETAAGKVRISPDTQNEVNVVGTAYSAGLRRLVERAARTQGLAANDKFDHESSQNTLFRCDHLPFLMKGIPAVWIFGGWHPGYHEPTDTVSRINFEKLTRVTQTTLELIQYLADSGTVPEFVRR